MKQILKIVNKRIKNEAGQAFIVVLLLLALGSLLIAPLLSYTSTGLQAGQVYEAKADEFYAADAGVEDALWLIRNNMLEYRFGAYPASGCYDPYHYYDFDGKEWGYTMSEQVNGKEVVVEIKNMWVPKGIAAPEPDMARVIIQGLDEENPPKLIITGSAPAGTNEFEINITFLPASGEEDDLLMQVIGVWLPPGFSYVPESSWLDNPDNDDEPYYSEPDISQHAGGTAVIWYFSDVAFTEFPGVDADSIQKYKLTFEYTSETEGSLPEGVSWLETTGVEDVSYSWDADIMLYRINSTAYSAETGSDTEVEAYSIKGQMRQLVSSIPGDYYATGNAFLYPSSSSGDNYKFRDVMYSSGGAVVASTPALDPVAGIPEDAFIIGAYLYWTGWIDFDGYNDSGGEVVWSDGCDTFGTWNSVWQEDCSSYNDEPYSWNVASHWSLSPGEFRSQGSSGPSDRVLELDEDIDLSAYTGQEVIISWDQDANFSVDFSDALYFALSADGGSTWSGDIEAFHGNNPSSPFSYTINDTYLTSQFRIRYFWDADSSTEYCYLDNIEIEASASIDWDPGVNWDIYNNDQFRCHGGGSTDDRTITRVTDIDLSAYTGQEVIISWDQDANFSVDFSDALYFALSADGGSTWSGDIEAFHGNNPSSPYEYTIPDEYLTSNFRIRFYWAADSSNEYCYIDDINIIASSGYTGLRYPDGEGGDAPETPENIIALVEENARVNTVLFGSTDDNITQIYADNYELIEPYIWNGSEDEGEGTWSYCCYTDVTNLVSQWIEDEELGINGAGTYTVTNAWVDVANEIDPSYSFNFADGGSTGYPLGTPAPSSGRTLKDQNCHSGWSIILIYSSPETMGHQMYLYDINNPGFSYTQARNIDPDFDGDGQPGGTVRGFLVPEKIAGEYEVGRVTVFVGEGDKGRLGDNWGDDYISINNHKVWDGIECFNNSSTSPNNAWNSESQGLNLTESGIDIDTFSISWASGILEESDVEATVNLPTDNDGIHIIYIILSFRSETSTGGTMTYLIR